jgi:hypothetical protein
LRSSSLRLPATQPPLTRGVGVWCGVVWSQKYDADGDGTISADELYQVMLGCGVQLTEVQLAEIIKEQDSDGVC